MEFTLNEEQRLLQEMVREFAQKEILPKVKDFEERKAFPQEIMKKLGELGILGMTVPAAFGGTDMGAVSSVLALEELSKASPAVCIITSVHCALFCYSIASFGSEAQKRKYLPRAAKGEILGAFSLSEPGAGSDALSLKTTSVRRGDRFVLNGRKAWVTTGSEAGAMILFTAAEDAGQKKKMTAFIVEEDFPGFKVTKLEDKMGLHASPTAEVTLEDCEVPAENLLGEEGQGAYIAFHCLDYSRIGVAAQAEGLAQRALEEAALYAKQREAFGRKIADFQAIQFMLADIATQTEASRLLAWKAASLKDQGKPFTAEAAMAKLYASEAANRTAYLALQVHGGYGYSQEFPIERIYREARVLSLYEGTSEVQRMVIARCLLKET